MLFEDEARPPVALENWRNLFPEMIGRSRPKQQVLETVARVARSDAEVLILGESGTGKELVAEAIHRLSPRSHKAFAPINCNAIPENLLEAQLFGYERGAFTGADRRQVGLLQAKSGGTIFLDEIGDMQANLQGKLLRVLEEKEFSPLGGHELIKADVRVVAATNIDLEQAVLAKTFRNDLFWRLNVMPIRVPPLRERREDVPLLVEHFLELFNRKYSAAEPCYFTAEAMEVLMGLEWPGNVRELQHLVQRVVLLRGGGAIRVEHLPETYRGKANLVSRPVPRAEAPVVAAPLVTMHSGERLPNEGIDLMNFIETIENDLIVQALERTGYNKNQAARLLGLNRTTLVERIKKRKIPTRGETF
jgi:transcriptional regulator with GAF, ATPase, and Fis domain